MSSNFPRTDFRPACIYLVPLSCRYFFMKMICFWSVHMYVNSRKLRKVDEEIYVIYWSSFVCIESISSVIEGELSSSNAAMKLSPEFGEPNWAAGLYVRSSLIHSGGDKFGGWWLDVAWLTSKSNFAGEASCLRGGELAFTIERAFNRQCWCWLSITFKSWPIKDAGRFSLWLHRPASLHSTQMKMRAAASSLQSCGVHWQKKVLCTIRSRVALSDPNDIPRIWRYCL